MIHSTPEKQDAVRGIRGLYPSWGNVRFRLA